MLFDFLATEVTNHKITAELINAIYWDSNCKWAQKFKFGTQELDDAP
jgi:hypothetical protein